LVSEADRLAEPTDFHGNDEIGVTATFYGIINFKITVIFQSYSYYYCKSRNNLWKSRDSLIIRPAAWRSLSTSSEGRENEVGRRLK
jgi:hypothetical protein